MDEKKQEAYKEVWDELVQKKHLIVDVHDKVRKETAGLGFGAQLSPQVAGILEGIEYALVIVDNLMLQDRKS